jgi:hypothetical protein
MFFKIMLLIVSFNGCCMQLPRTEVEEQEAPTTIKLLEDYVRKWGTPEDHGHQRVLYRGRQCVAIPPEFEVKIFKKHIAGVEWSKIQADLLNLSCFDFP